ncbi:MAG TPA: hypothetical protein VF432_13235 [Thermoanaerobaculia bacterium]
MIFGPDFDVADVDRGIIVPKIDLGGMASCAMQTEDDVPGDEIVSAEPGAELATRDEALPPVIPEPATLIRGFRLLAERIPGFRHLSPSETRSMIRASELDPEMIAAGIVAADVWEGAQRWMHMTSAELRELDTAIRESDEVIREMKILLEGMIGANRVRKHRRGKAILSLYKGLELSLGGPRRESDNLLQPYFDNMRSAYMKNRKRRKAKGETPEPKD